MNIGQLEKLLQDFYEISGMDIAVVDTKNRIIARRYSGNSFCAQIHKCPGCLDICIKSDEEHMAKAHQEKKSVSYTCPFGIFEAFVPIFEAGTVVAYLFLGMAVEDSRKSIELVNEKLQVATKSKDKTRCEEILSQIPRYSKDKLSAFVSMLEVIAKYIEEENLLSVSTEFIALMTKRYIKNNLSKKITLTDIAWHLHCSKVTLTEHFKKEYGMTIVEYITKKRMEKAARLLTKDDVRIIEVAESCGFEDTEYFSKCFKRFHGETPGKWQKKNAGKTV
ncbi:MAG: PocR ligand-binding domain-containing protein [Clostridia bacterium]|nr:PocR ligand-binding domain-containing protein [Clostridia bacterium]